MTPLDGIFQAIRDRTRCGGPNSASKYGPHVVAGYLGCQWIDMPGTSMKDLRWREAAAAVARRHENSDGPLRGELDR